MIPKQFPTCPKVTKREQGFPTPKVVMRSGRLEIGTDWVVVQERAPAD